MERTATTAGRRSLGRTSIEGFRLHERAVRAGCRVERVLVSRSFETDPSERARSLLRELSRGGAELIPAPDQAVLRLMEGRGGGGIVSLVPLPAPARVEGLLETVKGREASVLVAAGVDDPGNLGALARTALASGALAIALTPPGDPYHPRAVRTSMGSIFRLPVVRYSGFREAVTGLAALRFRTVGAVARGGTPLPEVRIGAQRVALVVGSEAFGLSEAEAGLLDRRVTIPMAGEIDSYSVNAAAAILLYAISRLRQTAPGSRA